MQDINYQELWKQLKKKLRAQIKYYKKGTMCSIDESIQGEIITKEILDFMVEEEKKNGRSV